jgi:hypothetical protein
MILSHESGNEKEQQVWVGEQNRPDFVQSKI